MKKFVLFLMLIPIFIYARFVEPAKIAVVEQVVSLSGWSVELPKTKIGIVSDLHIGCKFVNQKKLQEIVSLINSKNPDIVFLLGDYDTELISASKITEDEIVAILSQIKSKLGVYAVLGNHDYSNPDMIRSIMLKSGINLLEDTSCLVEQDSENITIVGLKDLWHSSYNNDFVKSFNDENIILLSHNPDVFPELPNSVDLTLSGHTHGGEIRFPFFGALFIPSKYKQKYGKGLIKEGEKTLYVTSGVGTLSRMRFLNPPEVVILDLIGCRS